MFKGIVSRKALAAVVGGSLLMAGCGDTTASDKNALSQARQAVTSAVSPVAAGRYHMLAVHSGAVWDWGGNQYAQLGTGTTDANTHQTPTQVSGLTGTFVSVAATEDSSLALRSDGTVWSWGYNGYGELGDGTYTQRTSPVQVQGLPTGSSVVAISADDNSHHVLALLSDGTVRAWGQNAYGQIGDGGGSYNWLTPVQVQTADVSLPYLTNVVAIAAGAYHSLAVRSDGSVWAWGRNNNGEVGDGTYTLRTKAVRVVGLPVDPNTSLPIPAVDVAAGLGFSLVLLNDGTVYSFGTNSSGKLGYGTVSSGVVTPNMSSTPVRVGSLTNITRIDASKYNGMAVDSSGTVWGWGDGGSSGPNTTPGVVGSSVTGSYLSGGESIFIVMDTNGVTWTWGAYNQYGQLGRAPGGSGMNPGTVTY